MYRRIAFTGPSGSGKTTLVKFVEEEFKLPWINGSSGGIKTPEQNDTLGKMGLSVGKGHLKIIQSGHMAPHAAIKNQWNILEQRMRLFADTPQFVTDRCTIDNWVYYLNQCSPYEESLSSGNFLRHCLQGVKYLTHVIFIPTKIPVEDNGSRIPNQHYQESLITPAFQHAMFKFQHWASNMNSETKFYRVSSSDLEERKQEIRQLLWAN